MANILQIEQERRLLQERKALALEECTEVERKLENLHELVKNSDILLSEKSKQCSDISNQINALTQLKTDLNNEIISIREEKTRILSSYDNQECKKRENIELLENERKMLQKDTLLTRISLENVQKEYAEILEKLKNTGEELVYLMKSVQEEKKELQEIVIEQEKEFTRLRTEKDVLLKTSEELQNKEKELYILREDLNIIKERYAQFARENNLPFNV